MTSSFRKGGLSRIFFSQTDCQLTTDNHSLSLMLSMTAEYLEQRLMKRLLDRFIEKAETYFMYST